MVFFCFPESVAMASASFMRKTDKPAAAEYLLNEACAQARALGKPRGDRVVKNGWPAGSVYSTKLSIAGGTHARCTLSS